MSSTSLSNYKLHKCEQYVEPISNFFRRPVFSPELAFNRIRSLLFRNEETSLPQTTNAAPSHKSAYNVLIVIENMSYTYDTRAQNIAKSLVGAGYQVNVICPRYSDDPKVAEINDVSVTFYYSPQFADSLAGHLLEYAYSLVAIYVLAISAFARKRIDILHVCNPPDLFFPLGKLIQLFDRNFIYDQHDRVPELFRVRYHNSNPVFKFVLRKTEGLSVRVADHVLATNESGKGNIIRRHGVSAHNVSIVRNGPNLELFPSNPVPGQNRASVMVGYIGNMNPQDSIDILLYSICHIKHTARYDNIRFVLIGDGGAYNSLVELSNDLQIDDIVEFTGRLIPEKAYQRLAEMDICVQPDARNVFTNTCTMVKVLEYMALRKPIVTFDLKETRYSCGSAALYAKQNCPTDFANQIIKIAQNSTLGKTLGDEGYRRLSEKFTWSHSEQHLLKAYAAVLNGKATAGNDL